MSTPLQDAANRANSQASTGPRTPAGKAASSQNARKHGLSSQYIPLSDEERPAFLQLEADLRSQVNPRGALQEVVFRQLVAAAWKRDIVDTLLCEASASTRDLFSDEASDRVRKLQRHKNDQDRAFNRALRQLKELQTTDRVRILTVHALEKANPGLDASNFEGLADYAKITKQSHLLRAKSNTAVQQQMDEDAKIFEAQIAAISKNFVFNPR